MGIAVENLTYLALGKVRDAVGLDHITPDVVCVTERVLENNRQPDPVKSAFEAMSIARHIRQLRAEVRA